MHQPCIPSHVSWNECLIRTSPLCHPLASWSTSSPIFTFLLHYNGDCSLSTNGCWAKSCERSAYSTPTCIDMFRVTLNGQRLLLIKYIQHLVLMAVYNVDFPHKIIKNEKIHSLLGKYCKTDQDNRVLTQNTCAGITCCMSIMFCAINSKILRQWKQEFYQRWKLPFYP
jgi:hypothetical protein